MHLFVKFCNMKDFFIENKFLVLLWGITILGLFIFVGHYSGILIDFGREVYYPQEILNGKILYKDLFNIYGPLAYQFNAVLYKIFGIKLSTLYGAGIFTSLLTVSGIYLIAQKFLSKFLSFAIGFFTIAIGVTATSIFNFHFPYSWAVMYGLTAFLYSLYFLLKYWDEKNTKNLYLSSFLAGIAITCKYDFLLYALIVFAISAKEKNWKVIVSFFIAPILSFGALFIQGLKIDSLVNSLLTTSLMAKSKTLIYFYQNSGIYFNPKAIFTDFILFLKTAIPFGAILSGIYLFNKKKYVAIFLSVIGWILFLLLFSIKFAFGFLPILLMLLFITELIKSKSENKYDIKTIILALSAIAVCAKVFWVMLLGSYGNYYVSISLVALFAILFKYLPKNLEKVAGIYILAISLIIILSNSFALKHENNKVSTPIGTMHTSKAYAESSNELIKYIDQNTKKDDKIVIFPEGITINFLTQRSADDYYNSLLPLYTETFGEEKIINHYKKNLPEFVIFNNLDMKDYYFRFICQDYALEFCGFVQNNYKLQTVIGDEFRYLIFKRK